MQIPKASGIDKLSSTIKKLGDASIKVMKLAIKIAKK